MGPILAVLLLSCSIEAQKQNRVCSRRGQRLGTKDGHLETIRISKAKGGMVWLTSFGETRIDIESTISPIEVSRSENESDLVEKGFFARIISSALNDATKTYSDSLSPFENHFIKVRPQTKGINMVFSSIDEEEICYIRKLHYFSFSRLAPLALGLLLFFNAKTLSRNLSFQYMGGITCGVGLSALVMIVLLGRMIPMKKNAFLTFIVGGSSIFMWFANRFKNQVADIATTYPWIVSMYLLITGVLSFFGVFWFEDNLKKPKYQQIVCWILQLVGIWCVSISSWNLLLNVGLVGALLFYEFIQFSSRYQPNWKKIGEKFNRKAAAMTKDSDGDSSKIFCTPQRSQKGTSSTFGAQCAADSTPRANFFSPVTRFLQRRPVTPANSIKKYLTKEEYEEQGLKETDAGLQALKDQIRASDDPWSLLKKLSSETRNKVIDFANGQSHLGSENEENQLDLDFSTSESDSDDDPLNTVSNRSLNRTYNVTHSHSKSPRHTPRENRTSNLRKQVLQKNTLSPRPNWK